MTIKHFLICSLSGFSSFLCVADFIINLANAMKLLSQAQLFQLPVLLKSGNKTRIITNSTLMTKLTNALFLPPIKNANTDIDHKDGNVILTSALTE